MLELLWIPVLLMTLLVPMHAWFGIGILSRGIIFTDLAIAQFAALGSAISLGYLEQSYFYPLSLGFALFSALLIAFASQRRIHLEAFIGLLYVIGASGIMIVLADSAEGIEHFKSLLASDILFTQDEELFHAMIIYAFVALLMWKVYPRLHNFYKEALFFSLLALTVTSSVQLSGVLVVFALLIAPALIGLRQTKYPPLLVAALYGWIITVAGVLFSFYFDLPTGYTIVFVLAAITLLFILFMSKKKSPLQI